MGRYRGPRRGRVDKHFTWLPGYSKGREEPVIDAVVASHPPTENEPRGEDEQQRVDAERAGEQIIGVHHAAEESREAGQYTKNESDTDRDFTQSDCPTPERGVREDEALQESRVPSGDAGASAR